MHKVWMQIFCDQSQRQEINNKKKNKKKKLFSNHHIPSSKYQRKIYEHLP